MAQMTQKSHNGFFIPRSLRWLTLVGAFLTLGIAMPSCPGQQEMKQQLDTLQNSQTESNRRLQQMDSQVRTMSQDISNKKQGFEPLAGMIQADHNDIQQLKTQIQDLSNKIAAMGGRGGSSKHGAYKKRGR